ncbi:MAG TPA: hypothetical protein DEG76_00515 [Pseudohongiella sp.]|nr:hypothetical protein [Pseudohongiella sp.]MAY54476.1 hypothetical protein [Gammaproteobacteria bacterium]MBJ56573.1 hypothetical protein [Gammaproteobacteria bacterium]HBN14736.1 hypothetical protein [Pseudohongiella sp.]HBX35861.1 hypothetical protein [Pseudohongiella sp.]
MKRSQRLACLTSISSVLLASAALAQNPYIEPDSTWISIDGTVESVSPDSFLLDYGQGSVFVEMDDGDRDADGYKLMPGDRVTVSGLIDDDFYELTTLEASSVYVEHLGTYFYASALDEEDSFVDVGPVNVSDTTFQGMVSSVDAEAEQFRLASGAQMITVNVDEMSYNPLDDEGYQKITPGDVVSVTGNIDIELFEGRVFDADLVTTLHDRDREDS